MHVSIVNLKNKRMETYIIFRDHVEILAQYITETCNCSPYTFCITETLNFFSFSYVMNRLIKKKIDKSF